VEAYTQGTNASSNLYVGGLAGTATGIINGCVSAVTKVDAGSDDQGFFVYAGGITGQGGTITGCSLNTDSAVAISAKKPNGGVGNVYAGGIVGNGNASDCFVDAPVTVTAESANAGFTAAGGIAGSGSQISNSAILRGAVLARMTGNATADRLVAAGGIVGTTGSNPNISNCFSGADVTVDSACKAVLDSAYVTAAGGIAGSTSSGNIENCVSSGPVKVISTSAESGGKAFAGGIAGFSFGSRIVIRRGIALNESVTVQCETNTTPYVYRILGGVMDMQMPTEPPWTILYEVWPVSDIPTISDLILQNNYGLPNMTAQTSNNGGASWMDVAQLPNDTANLMGSGNMRRTQGFFESLGWDFVTNWEWNAELDAPLPRIR
jgi:hypothetical protein